MNRRALLFFEIVGTIFLLVVGVGIAKLHNMVAQASPGHPADAMFAAWAAYFLTIGVFVSAVSRR